MNAWRAGWLVGLLTALPPAWADDEPRCGPVGPAGQQRCAMPDGSTLQRAMSADGRRAMALLRRWSDGSLAELRCAPTSLLPEDRGPCGHGGELAEVTLYREPGKPLGTVSHRRGVLIRQVIVNPQGGVVRSEEFVDNTLAPDRRIKRVYYPSGRLRHEIDLIEPPPEQYPGREGVGREFAESGQLTQEVEWVGGRERRIRQWHLNGRLKLDQTIRHLGRDELRETRSFYEDGAEAALNRERNGRLFGWQQYHAPGGALQREEEYGERGVLLRRKLFDPRGHLLRDERVNEDPSSS
jgi:hypothetical protein